MSESLEERTKAFAGKLLGLYTGAALSHMIHIGYETGLFEAAKEGPATSTELSARAGLNERYVREWLGAMTTGGLFTHDAESHAYTLPPEHAMMLTGNAVTNLAPLGKMLHAMAKPLPQLIDCFRNGGGVPSDMFRPDFTHCMDDMWRRIYDAQLQEGFIGAVQGLTERLQEGMQVLELGCGTGHAANLLGDAYPKSTFLGLDVAGDAIAAAREEASAMGLSNVGFDLEDITETPQEPRFDLITAFDVIHDLPAPTLMLKRLREALRPDGLFVMVEFKFASNVGDNVGNPFAPMYYSISTLYCTTVSLAQDGEGLGTVWGEETARRMLGEAGFSRVDTLDAPRPQNVIFVCRP